MITDNLPGLKVWLERIILTIKTLKNMGTKVYSEIAIKNAIRILAKAGKAGQLTKEQVDAAFEALGIEEARTPEECAAWAREWTPSFFRAFLEAISFTRGYHSIDDIVTAVKERLAA